MTEAGAEWITLMALRDLVNAVLERARVEKAINDSFEACVTLRVVAAPGGGGNEVQEAAVVALVKLLQGLDRPASYDDGRHRPTEGSELCDLLQARAGSPPRPRAPSDNAFHSQRLVRRSPSAL